MEFGVPKQSAKLRFGYLTGPYRFNYFEYMSNPNRHKLYDLNEFRKENKYPSGFEFELFTWP